MSFVLLNVSKISFCVQKTRDHALEINANTFFFQPEETSNAKYRTISRHLACHARLSAHAHARTIQSNNRLEQVDYAFYINFPTKIGDAMKQIKQTRKERNFSPKLAESPFVARKHNRNQSITLSFQDLLKRERFAFLFFFAKRVISIAWNCTVSLVRK